ncbi:hypothetical protein AM493_02845 [Flavobacterium akiainvivens]|uniref:Uncharacterized protein n=1 Tax=Flavobacterium akiainvivens TaxID=1202724 RepID=A0A0M9VH20_9FLAO|nr:hypothetical protein [Flavobacterium akiainvivens]KOS05089.1 hypothetical protein AM493_02845 [Flavobacterium akiainvivens]SFQ51745.1 hypothetical protein SAMN05444144_106235 [Flavobacterium akiainvivens]
MKTFSLILSLTAFSATLYFLVTDFPDVTTLNGLIYFGIMLILLMVCVTGIIINWPLLSRIHNRFRLSYK